MRNPFKPDRDRELHVIVGSLKEQLEKTERWNRVLELAFRQERERQWTLQAQCNAQAHIIQEMMKNESLVQRDRAT
jgi:hypothetical protein